MGKTVDKLMILALSLFVMVGVMKGDTFLVSLYILVAISAVNYYLIDRADLDYSMIRSLKSSNMKERLAFILEFFIPVAAIFYPSCIALISLGLYDITISRNYIAAFLALAAIVNAAVTASLPAELIIYIIIISALSIILSIRTERQTVTERSFKALRDDSEEKSSRLRSQNNELLNARDTEIHNAQLSERNRIAREIHDNVGHTLSRAILQMGALLAIHKEEPIHTELEGVRETLDTAMNNIRSSVHDLHDDSIDVKASIAQLAEPLKEKYNLSMDIDIGEDMPRPVKYSIIGITKECISNIIKHSRNTDVIIHLNEHPSMYQLIIHDFGYSGSDGPTRESSDMNDDTGMGLENIRTRVESVNGTLNISTQKGFRVFVTIPK